MDIIPLLEENRRNILRQAVGNNQIPRILYKYCSRERALQIIGNHSIMFSSFTAFNDPFDCAVTIDGHNTPEEWHTYLSMQGMMPGYRNITNDHGDGSADQFCELRNCSLIINTMDKK